jgi:hypothetical protein
VEFCRLIGVGDSEPRKRLRLRRPDRCAVCDRALAVGDEAVWYRHPRTVTCLGCDPGETTVIEGQAGASALREHQRRRERREQRAGDKLGRLGAFIARIADEPQTTKAWNQGGAGEVRAAARFTELLHGHGVRLLHDRRIPGHGNANIDHIAIGPGGITVIDTKTHRGKVRVERIGGLFSARRSVLTIAGRNQTSLIDAIERQLELVRTALRRVGDDQIDVRGGLCFPDVDGLPILDHLSAREIIIDGPRPVAKLARRPGPLDPKTIDRIWTHLGHTFPPA